MKIKDILARDPATHPLVNQGQARISDTGNVRAQSELRGELETFVCEGQYAEGIHKILRSFLDSLGKTSQRGSWVSGFFGSGKSHLLKMLCHLWQDTQFDDGATARSLVPSMPDDIRSLLRELDTVGKRAGGLLAAAGALPSGSTDNVRLSVLGVLLRAVGLPEQYAQARFCLWLHSQNRYQFVRSAVEAAGKSFEKELNNLYVSMLIARSLIDCDPQFASSESTARDVLMTQFPPQLTDITTAEFLATAKDCLRLAGRDNRPPCTLLILDEVQQYIGQSGDRSVLVTEVAEAVSKQLDSHVMIVAAGQSALTDVQLLQKLMDRFTIRVPLSDTDVEAVTRKVLLQKKPAAISDVRAMLDTYAGEVSRQLQGTRIGEIPEDRDVIVDDYPLLPVRRRFWEHCFRQVDAAGTSSQLRSQLRIIHDAVAILSDHTLGRIIPADALFEALAPEMVVTGVLLREINERIVNIGHTEGPLAQRICGLVFLIGKLQRDSGADIGVRATTEHLADLMIDDLCADNGMLREKIEQGVKRLSDQGVLMQVGDEYRIQTREGSEWDREFRNRQTRLNNDDTAIQIKRDQLLYGEVDRIVRSMRIVQGAAKQPRALRIYRGDTSPETDGEHVPVWVRDGWSSSEKEVLDASRAAGTQSPIVFAFIPKRSAEDLRRLIVDEEAATQTLDAKGNPTTAEGQEARQSMVSRQQIGFVDRDALIREIVLSTKVFQAGGTEILLGTLAERLNEAINASLVRLFPRFKEADAAAWEQVIKRAREGADNPFSPVGHSDGIEKHAVCHQILAVIASGKTGSEIRKTLESAPFGWPRDAVDAGLIALHRVQFITAAVNGQAVPNGQLDQNKIPRAQFRVERATLAVADRIALRGLFQKLGISCKSGDEAACASEFLDRLLALAKSSGGEAPMPSGPSTAEIEDIQRLIGNEQLVAIRAHVDGWDKDIKNWTHLRDLIAQRMPAWDIVSQLAANANGVAQAAPILQQIAAIRDQRLLVEPSDPVNSVRVELAGLLRSELQSAITEYQHVFDAALKSLQENGDWTKLDESQRQSIKARVGLVQMDKPDMSTDQKLCDALARTSLSAIQAETFSISGRVSLALKHAAEILEPKVTSYTLERSTLRTAADVESWIERQRTRLLQAVEQGPVLVD